MQQPRRPVVGNIPPVKKPVLEKNYIVSEKWSFSFEYFRQIEYFGLSETASKWFVSFLNKLTELSGVNPHEFEKNQMLKSANRYHKINWSAKNIPYRRTDFTWISSNIIDNDEEFPFFQFQVSRGLGRIIGFWDLNKTFQIVLLDTKHNMQPSKTYNYAVDDTSELYCELTSVLIDLDTAKQAQCSDKNCNVKLRLSELPTRLNRGNFVYMLLDDEYYEELSEQLKTRTLKEIVEIGLISLNE